MSSEFYAKVYQVDGESWTLPSSSLRGRKGRFDKVNLQAVRGRTQQNINTSHVYIQVETTQLNKKYGCTSLLMSFGPFLSALNLDPHW